MRERLDESIDRFGLEELRGRRPQTLSGGEQQKLALAAITARRPPLLVLDEPLSMLDVTAATDLAGQPVGAGPLRHRRARVRAPRRLPGRRMPGLRVMALDRAIASPTAPARPAPGPARAIRPEKLDGERPGGEHRRRRHPRGLSFSIEPGEVTAIVGRNGCGKTTLLRALAGLQTHEGSVTADGKRPDLGHVFQNADLQLFNPTVRKEILFRVKEPDMELYSWLIRVLGLRRYENTPPLILSEGEKKRVALADGADAGPGARHTPGRAVAGPGHGAQGRC